MEQNSERNDRTIITVNHKPNQQEPVSVEGTKTTSSLIKGDSKDM